MCLLAALKFSPHANELQTPALNWSLFGWRLIRHNSLSFGSIHFWHPQDSSRHNLVWQNRWSFCDCTEPYSLDFKGKFFVWLKLYTETHASPVHRTTLKSLKERQDNIGGWEIFPANLNWHTEKSRSIDQSNHISFNNFEIFD